MLVALPSLNLASKIRRSLAYQLDSRKHKKQYIPSAKTLHINGLAVHPSSTLKSPSVHCSIYTSFATITGLKASVKHLDENLNF